MNLGKAIKVLTERAREAHERSRHSNDGWGHSRPFFSCKHPECVEAVEAIQAVERFDRR